MNKKFSFLATLMCVMAMFLFDGCAERNRADQNTDTNVTHKSDALVVYFTWSGHLQSMAHWVADEIGADYVRVLRKEEYPEGYSETADVAKVEHDKGIRPEILPTVSEEDIAGYNTIFVGFPVWWYDVPMPILSFLESFDLKGKTIVPFFSHEGSSDGAGALPTLEKYAKEHGVNFNAKTALSVRGSSVKDAEQKVRDWVKGLGISVKSLSETRSQITFPIGEKIPKGFKGDAYFKNLIQKDSVFNFPVTNHITFAPGSHSGWHVHGGMEILVTGGKGYYQEEGKKAQIIRKGDVVHIPAGVRHWHGAAPDSWFSQIVIYDADWKPGENATQVTASDVTDEWYNNLETEEYAGRTLTEKDSFMFGNGSLFPSENFSGNVYLGNTLDAPNEAGAPGIHNVVFDAGTYNNWHIHAGGQILIATDGIGYHQIEGQPVEILRPGDVAFCPPGVKHWHGATATSKFAHLATNTNPDKPGVQWLDRLPVEEYKKLPQE